MSRVGPGPSLGLRDCFGLREGVASEASPGRKSGETFYSELGSRSCALFPSRLQELISRFAVERCSRGNGR
jgi:hypothetical protein